MSDVTSLEKDTQSRNRIISDIRTNFFVEAGAGSGKTTMLVSRMVAMVEAGIPIDKICAITFTKAAAGEFYGRFQKLLIERSNPDYVWEDKGYAGQLPKPTKESMELCAEALKNIDLCFMGTIDSFCGMVLSEHPTEAGIPSDASIMSDLDAEIFYKQQYVRICSGEYGEELAGMASTFRAFYRNAEEVFVQGEALFMNNRNVHFNYPENAIADVDKTFADERDELIRVVKCLAEHPELQYDREQKSRDAWEKIEDFKKNICRRWSSNFSNVIYALKGLKNVKIIPEAMNRYETILSGTYEPGGKTGKWLECNIDKEDGLLKKLQDLQYSASMAFLLACVPYLEEAMRDKGNMTYFDYLYYLRNMLRRDAEGDGKLIRYIYDRHSYFLIDEFQDTNPMQAEVFFYLASEHPVPQWSACEPRPGSLFIVGDPKQSIYRFRSADVSSFLKVKGLFEKNGGAILSLSRNFRSTKTLCSYFNRSFSALLPEETKDQSKFEEIPLPDEKTDEFQGVYVYTAYTGKLEADHPDEADSEQIAKIIESLVDQGEYLVRTQNDKEPRKLRYSDIMVITYGKKKLGPIMARLDEKGIPTRVEGQVPFGSNQALLEVFKVYSAVADADDAMAMYGALTGKLIGLTKEEILRYRTAGGKVTLKSKFDAAACNDETACFVAKKIEDLKALYYAAQSLSPAALFAKVMDDYRVYTISEAENLEVVYYTLELLRNAERAGLVVSLKDGAAYVTELMSGLSDEERCLSLNDKKDAVHMANLHKVKGLEAPIVILSAATQFNHSNDRRIVHGDDGSEGYVFNLPKEDENGITKGSYFETKKYADEKEAENAASAAENQRLIYVAATRARNALIICDSITASGKSEGHKSVWKPLMEESLPGIFEMTGDIIKKAKKIEEVDSAKLYEEAQNTCVLNDRGMEKSTYSAENPSRLHLSSKMAEGQETDSIAVEEGTVVLDAGDVVGDEALAELMGSEKTDVASKGGIHKFPALLGTMTHKLMEMLVSTRNKVDASGAVAEIIREYRTPVMEAYESELSAALLKVAEKMRSGGYAQSNGLPQDMLGTLMNADKVYCEVPFCYSEDGEEGKIIWNGIMDVVYCSQGKWHIVDYKTNADGSDLDKKYQAQLVAYVKAFRATTGEEADAMTYHIDV